MRHRLLPILILIPATLAAQPQPVFLDALGGADPSARAAAFEGAAAQSLRLIPHVDTQLDSDDPALARAARIALEKIVAKASEKPESRFEASQLLAAKALSLHKPEVVLELVGWCGGEESLIGLAAMLNSHPQHADAVLATLERILRELRPKEAVVAKVLQELSTRIAAATPQERLALWPVVGVAGSEGALALFDEGLTRIADIPGAEAGMERKVILDALAEGGAFVGDTASLAADHPALLLRFAERQEPEAAFEAYATLLEQRQESSWIPAALLGMGSAAASARQAAVIIPYLGHERADIAGAARNALLRVKDDRLDAMLEREARKAEPLLLEGILEVLDTRAPEAAAKLRERAAGAEN